jgi:Holliday junction resolvase
MPSAAKQKGNAWERDVAKDLSETFNENFIRVPNSGAYTGGANVFRIDQLTEQQKRMMDGDIMVPPCLSRYKIECKNYKAFDFHQLFNENKTLNKWIKQAEFGLLWFLVIKVTRKGSFILFRKEISKHFSYKNYLSYKDKYVITDYKEFWQENADAIRRLNEDSTIEL